MKKKARVNPEWVIAPYAVHLVNLETHESEEIECYPRFRTAEDAINRRNPVFKYIIVEISGD